jgi:pyroglutamyl-peptidase
MEARNGTPAALTRFVMRNDPMPNFPAWTAAACAGLAAVVLAALFGGCASEPAAVTNPNANFLRDFLDGKFDGDGHPLNARINEGEVICAGAGDVNDASVRLSGACTAAVMGGEQAGDLVANARLAIRSHASSGSIATIEITDGSGASLAKVELTVATLREGEWIDLPASWSSTGAPVKFEITPAAGAVIDLDYVEIFPTHFGLVLAPGSGPIADLDHLTFELPLSKKITQVELDGVDITTAYTALLDAGTATKTTTTFRQLIDVAVADLAPARGDVAELKIHTATETQRMQLRRTAPACSYTGDSSAPKVLVTGFQPFPADDFHDNVSGVAVSSLDLAAVHGAQVMRIILPVEYDRSAAEVADAIARCKPDLVISFGQGGDAIALEHTAYNLQDTGEVAGGVPDNRGIVRAAVAIDPAAPATRPTLLPLDAINAALVAAGESPDDSTDPGRYICNNVMFADLGAIQAQGHGRAGFIHLPYTTDFDAATKARFAKVVQLAIETTLAN